MYLELRPKNDILNQKRDKIILKIQALLKETALLQPPLEKTLFR